MGGCKRVGRWRGGCTASTLGGRGVVLKRMYPYTESAGTDGQGFDRYPLGLDKPRSPPATDMAHVSANTQQVCAAVLGPVRSMTPCCVAAPVHLRAVLPACCAEAQQVVLHVIDVLPHAGHGGPLLQDHDPVALVPQLARRDEARRPGTDDSLQATRGASTRHVARPASVG